MINVDLSKLLPSRAHEYLAAFLPGLFFVLSVALASPDFSTRLTANLEHSLGLGRYTTIGFVLFLAFVVGHAFMLVDTLIQYVLGYAYMLKIFLYRQFCEWPLQQITQRLIAVPRFRGGALVNFDLRVRRIAQVGFQDWTIFRNSRNIMARRLLEIRYGVTPGDLNEPQWEALCSNLGTVTPEEARGTILMIATHAIGWAGLIATRIAPLLRNRYYVGFCLFLILNGLLHDYYVAKRKFDPRISGNLVIRAVLREFPKTEKPDAPPAAPVE